jgi:uncharacterized phage infection (PIP) family protein YhgE
MTLSEQIERFIKDTNIAHLIIHGDSSTVVTTEGGPVRSFAKVIADADLYLISGTSSILNQLQQLIPTVDQLDGVIDQVESVLTEVQEVRDDFNTDVGAQTAIVQDLVDDASFYASAAAASAEQAEQSANPILFLTRNLKVVTESYTLDPIYNAVSAGPITINPGVDVEISPTSKWIIL